jgi:hypothetical protein
MTTMANDKLKSSVYNGEQRRWDFEKYINMHKSQHMIMEGLVEPGYTGIDPRSKVCYLLDGIKTDKFDSVKTCIMSDATLQNNFDACVTLYQDFIKQTVKAKSTPTVGISELKTSGGRRKNDAIEDHYYTKSEYDALSPDAKRELAAKRLKRGHKPGARDSKTSKGLKSKGKTNADVNKNLKAVQRSVSQLVKQQTSAQDGSTTNSNDDSSEATPKKASAKFPSNRANAALTRQPKKASM